MFPRKAKLKMFILDVSRAHSYADSVREVYAELPKEHRLEALVHGDDMGVVGEEAHSMWIEKELGETMVSKRRALLGPDDQGLPEGVKDFDNRCGNRVEIPLREVSLDGPSAKPVATQGTKDGAYLDDRPIEGSGATRYRSMCMRVGHISQDGPHLQ